jgi:Uma2 family endonuclease
MGEAAPTLKMTEAEYLAFERASAERHEFVDGEIFAMSGGKRAHNLIGAHVVGELRAALLRLGRPCDVYGSDQKISPSGHKFFYPDASVICGKPTYADEEQEVITNPRVIVEVLSDSTERYDRVGKFAAYRAIPTFADYLLVSQTEILVEHYHRLPDGTWAYRALGPGEQLVLPSVECSIPVDQLYLRVFTAE